MQHAEDRDVEIDLASWGSRIWARWWIVLAAIVVALVVTVATGVAGGTSYTAKALIFLGQPFSPSGSPLNVSPGNNPYTPGLLVKQEEIVRAAASKAGLTPDELRPNISTQVADQAAVQRASYTPYVYIIVSGPWERKAGIAANALADQVLAKTSGYEDRRIPLLKAMITRQKAEQVEQRRREKDFENNLEQIRKLPADQQLLVEGTVLAALNQVSIRIENLEDQLSNNEQTLALAQELEVNRLVTRAVPVKTTAAPRAAGYAIAILVGLVIGAILALLSYSLVPARRHAHER